VGRPFRAGLAAAAQEAGLAVQVPVAGPLVGIFFGPSAVTDYEGARLSASSGLYRPSCAACWSGE